jgi:hypothetical protein
MEDTMLLKFIPTGDYKTIFEYIDVDKNITIMKADFQVEIWGKSLTPWSN